MEQVLGEVNPPGLQGAAKFLATVAEGAGEVELFIATKQPEQVRTPCPVRPALKTNLSHPDASFHFLW